MRIEERREAGISRSEKKEPKHGVIVALLMQNGIQKGWRVLFNCVENISSEIKEWRAEIEDISDTELIDRLKCGSIELQGIKAEKNSIKTEGWSLRRLAKIQPGMRVSGRPLIIIGEACNSDGSLAGYITCFHDGIVSLMGSAEAAKYGSIHGIVNGEIKKSGSGEYIQRLGGKDWDVFDVSNSSSNIQIPESTAERKAVNSTDIRLSNINAWIMEAIAAGIYTEQMQHFREAYSSGTGCMEETAVTAASSMAEMCESMAENGGMQLSCSSEVFLLRAGMEKAVLSSKAGLFNSLTQKEQKLIMYYAEDLTCGCLRIIKDIALQDAAAVS